MPFTLFYGNDIKLLREELKFWEEKLYASHPDLDLWNPDTTTVKEILEKISSKSLFAQKQFIKIYEIEKLSNFQKLLEYETDDIVVFVSYQEKNPFKAKKKGLEVKCFNLPKDYEIEKLLFKELRGICSDEVLNYLSKNINSLTDIRELKEKITQLNISYLDMSQLYKVQGDLKAKAYLIAEDICQKKLHSSIIEINQFLESGESPTTLINSISKRFEQLLQIKILSSNNLLEAEIAEKLKLHPFIVKKLKATSNRYSLSKLENLNLKVPQLEFYSRNYDKEFLPYFFEQFVMDVCA